MSRCTTVKSLVQLGSKALLQNASKSTQYAVCAMSTDSSNGEGQGEGSSGSGDGIGESAEKESSRIISRSAIFVQNGLAIKELPVILRKLQSKEISYTGAIMANDYNLVPPNLTQKDESFKLHLKSCNTLEEVISLLEIPCGNLSAYSAACALQRLEHLTGISDGRSAVTFVQQAVFKDLCARAVSDLPGLSTQMLEALTQCHLSSKAYSAEFAQAIDDEFDRRLTAGTLTIQELCSFIKIISENIAGSSERVHNIFVHLASRCNEVTTEHVSAIWPVLRYMSPESKFILELLNTALLNCWQSLTADDIEAICRVSPMLNNVNRDVMHRIADWLYMNVHILNDNHLLAAITAFTRYRVTSARLINVLERYSSGAPRASLQPALAAVSMEYCRQQKLLSSPLFDRIAIRFARDWRQYSTQELLMVVRPFGQLNYRPTQSVENALYEALDVALRERIHEIRITDLLELLVACAFVQRMPVNFFPQIFSLMFMSKLKALPPDERLKASIDLMELRECLLIEMPHLDVAPLLASRIRFDRTIDTESKSSFRYSRHFTNKKMHNDVWRTLLSLYGPNYVRTPHIAHSGTRIDLVMQLDEDGNFIDMYDIGEKIKVKKRLALVCTDSEDYCQSHKKHLMGEKAMYIRHLEIMGYTVVEVSYYHFKHDPRAYIQSIMKPHLVS